jgi:UDP-N-acetylmuramoyl-tripeptide--D-alanyl-D-alanine ligase
MMSLQDAASAAQGRLTGADARFSGVSTDSRSIVAGELFIAIRGERFDGHEFLGAAKQRGAAAAMVDTNYGGQAPIPAIVVDDTRKGLGRLGRNWRLRFAPALIAIAGSNGKTTTKEMLAAILRSHAGEAGTLATRGNLNTDIGVPLTLLGLRAGHRYCAVELGMNHPGEIAMLAQIAQPTIAVVTNAQREHMEFMKSVAATADENAGAYRALPSTGIAVVNAEDGCYPIFMDAAGKRRRVEFGLQQGDITGRYELKALQSEIVLKTPAGEARATLAIPGLHNVRNALAAAACAHAAGIPPTAIGAGLSAFRPYSGRLQVKRTAAGVTLIDDSYNANPDSVRAAIDVLATQPAPTILILGDMGEVGQQGPEFHKEIGAYARAQNISSLFALGDATPDAVDAFGAAGHHAKSLEDLLHVVRERAIPGATILVKGSRFMKMERVVAALTGEKGAAH